MRFYDLKMYSIVVFDYYGYGNFTVQCFNHMAVSITHPSVEPMFFFNKENYKNWIMDEFIYCRNHDVTERYLACIHYNVVRLDCEQSLMVIRQYSSMEDLDNMATSLSIYTFIISLIFINIGFIYHKSNTQCAQLNKNCLLI